MLGLQDVETLTLILLKEPLREERVQVRQLLKAGLLVKVKKVPLQVGVHEEHIN